MKFECKADVFIKAVQQVSKARSRNQNQNYLQDIHLELDNHLLSLRATNLELFCEKSIPVKGVVNGKCLLHGETLLKIISTFQTKDTTLNCEVVDGVFIIKTENGQIEIKNTPYEEFPRLPKQGNIIGTTTKEVINTLFKDVVFCAATTEIKPEIAAIYLYTKNDLIYSVATDSYRLAEKTTPNKKNYEISVLIPQKHINEILQIINEENEELILSSYDNIFSITSPNLTLSINTITGQFPDYQQLFPKEFITTTEISKEELSKALTLTTFFNEQYAQVKCDFKEQELVLHSKNENVGQVTQKIKINKKGDDIEAKYNNRYFLESFSHIEGGTIKCMFTTPNRPMFIKGTKNNNFTYLLMPLN